MGNEWVSSRQASSLLDRGPHEAIYLAQQGYIAARRNGRLWEFDAESIRAYVEEEAKWVSAQEASDLTGLHIDTIKRAARRGDIERRQHNHARPSISRASALGYAKRRRRRRQTLARRAAARVERKIAREQPPQDGDVWLSVTEAALVLGMTPSNVRKRLMAERLPGVQSPTGRWWLRRGHAEQAAAARTFSDYALKSSVS